MVMRPLQLLFVWLMLGSTLLACNSANQATPPDHSLAAVLSQERFISYVPRSFSIHNGTPESASIAGVRDDLNRLRPYFTGLITYGLGSGQDAIAGLAVAAGFRSIILGIWDPTNREELDTAIKLTRLHPMHITALVIGNEGLFWKRYSSADISAAAAYLRAQLPTVALGSSEPFSVYLDSADAPALLALDLILPNVHPRFEPWFDPANTEQAISFVAEVLERLHARTDKPVLIKETGLPSAPASQGFTEARQAEFWSALFKRIPSGPTQNIACFEAFDAPWKPAELEDEFGRLEPSEAHWGLFHHDGSPKAVLDHLGDPMIQPASEQDSR